MVNCNNGGLSKMVSRQIFLDLGVGCCLSGPEYLLGFQIIEGWISFLTSMGWSQLDWSQLAFCCRSKYPPTSSHWHLKFQCASQVPCPHRLQELAMCSTSETHHIRIVKEQLTKNLPIAWIYVGTWYGVHSFCKSLYRARRRLQSISQRK